MTSASLDRLLAVLVVALAATGLLSLRAGTTDDAWVFVLHGILAGALAVAVGLKLRRSLPRAAARGGRRRLALGLVVALGAIGALAFGYLWVAGGRIVWLDLAGLVRWTVLTIHAWIGLVLVPLMIVHLLPQRWRLLRPGRGSVTRVRGRLSRRSFLTAGAFALAGIGLRGTADLADRLGGEPRRFTGSRWLPSGGVPPPTTFFGEPAPAIDPARWRLTAGDRSFALEELAALGETERSAVLDCTSGWALETAWQGVPLATVLGAAGMSAHRPVLIRSVTGWATVIPPAEIAGCLLAWGVAGRDLPVANGAPLRLVAPDRRGLDWVKWVASVEEA